MTFHGPTLHRNCNRESMKESLPVSHNSPHHQLSTGEGNRSGIADLEGNSPLSQLIIRNGTLHNDWKQRNVKGDDGLSGQQSVAWFPELERVLSSENTGACELPQLPWINTAWPVSRILHHNDGQAGRPLPQICLAIRPAQGWGLRGPSRPSLLTWWASSSSFLPFPDTGNPWTQKLEYIRTQTGFFPCLPPFRKCIVTNSGYKMVEGWPHLDFFFFFWKNKTKNQKVPTKTNPTTSS